MDSHDGSFQRTSWYSSFSSGRMHRCLSIPEVIHLICDEFLTERGAVGENARALASLARTSRWWSEVALDRLWYQVHGIGPLIRCMPKDLWTLRHGCLDTIRPLKNSDLQIFRKYAPRVRYLVLINSNSTGISPYHALSLSIRAPILPNLIGLTWQRVAALNFPYINLFLCQRLQSLRIRISIEVPEQVGLLNAIPMEFSPNISDLNIELVRPSTGRFRNAERLGDSFFGWRNLSCLTMRDLSLDILLAVAALPKLRKLVLSGARDIWVTQNQDKKYQERLLEALKNLDNPFPALESLNLEAAGPVRTITKLFKLLRGAKLLGLGLHFAARWDTLDHITELLQAVGMHCDHLSLRTIRFCYSSSGEPSLPFSALTPLLQFSRLEMVMVTHHKRETPTIISEEQMLQIASSWPNLRFLSVTPCTASRYPLSASPISLLAILPLVRQCRNLCYLALPIDASNPAATRTIRESPEVFEGLRNYSVRILEIGDSPILDKELVASFLSEVFPNLKDIKSTEVSSNENSSAYHRRWQYIAQSLLPLLARARKRENRFSNTGRRIDDIQYHAGKKLEKLWSKRVGGTAGHWSFAEHLS